MNVLRPIRKEDLEALYLMASSASAGMSSLPSDRELLQERIARSLLAFSREESLADGEDYLFVLEDVERGVLGGVCGIHSMIGLSPPLFSYQVKHVSFSSRWAISEEIPLLFPQCKQHNASEICSLYLAPEMRQGGWGKLLSLSRFLFMASFPNRFQSQVMAKIRGVFDKEGRSPFWEGIGRFFFSLDCEELAGFLEERGSAMAESVLPYPLYVSLLPPEAQRAIGTPHPHAEAAYQMLQEEGFCWKGDIDLLDGGPVLSVPREEIRAIRESKRVPVLSVGASEKSLKTCLLSTEQREFRACIASVDLREEGIVLPEESARALEVAEGAHVRALLLD